MRGIKLVLPLVTVVLPQAVSQGDTHFDPTVFQSVHCIVGDVDVHQLALSPVTSNVGLGEEYVRPSRVHNFCLQPASSSQALQKFRPENFSVQCNSSFEALEVNGTYVMASAVARPVWNHFQDNEDFFAQISLPPQCEVLKFPRPPTEKPSPLLVSIVQQLRMPAFVPNSDIFFGKFKFPPLSCNISGGSEPSLVATFTTTEAKCSCGGAKQHVFDFRHVEAAERASFKHISDSESTNRGHDRTLDEYSDEVREAAIGLHEHYGFSSFLSEEETVMGSGAIKMILTPVMHGVMHPVIMIVVGDIADRFMEVMGNQIREILEQNVPPNAAQLLASTLIPYVTNGIVDSLTARLTASLSESLTVELGTSLEYSVSKSLLGTLRESLVTTLVDAVPAVLRRALPAAVVEPLQYIIVSSLTTSITHALVPTLTSVLTSERHQSLACSNCYYHQTHCNLCRFSPANQYYDNYYATYYSDYYSQYYGNYYDKALEDLITLRNTTAKKVQEDYKKNMTLKHGG